MGDIGVLLGVALLIIFALRGNSIIVASLICSVVVAATNGLNPLNALMVDYVTEMMAFAGPFFLLFITGSVFGRMMSESRAALSIALKLGSLLGAERALVVGTLVCALLTYGGVNVFIVIFTVYPLGLGLMRQSNIPKRLFMAASALGAGTFTMTAMPGAPSFQNIIAARISGTSLTAAPVAGLIASAIMLVLGLAYLEWQRRRAELSGDGFVPAPTDVIPEMPEGTRLPSWIVSSLPMAVILGLIIVPRILNWFAPLGPDDDSAYAQIMRLANDNPLPWTVVAMSVGTLLGFLLFPRALADMLGIMGRGAESAILPLFNTAVVIGFGGVVKSTPAFTTFSELMLDSGLNPLISSVISINIMSGIMGSATGALQIFGTTLGPEYLQMGLDPDVMHRLVAIAAGGLDSLPHSGAIVTTLTIMGLTHRQAYKDTAVVTVLIPLIATVVLIAGYMVLGGYMVTPPTP